MPIFVWLVRCFGYMAVLGLLSISALAQRPSPSPYASKPNPRQLDSLRRAVWQAQRVRIQDPALRNVPTNRLAAARQAIQARQPTGRHARAANMTWTERGPFGITGTIQALLIDPLDTTRRKLWAGSLTAGLWVNNDISNPDSSWRCVSDGWGNHTIVSLATDSDSPKVRYALTGATSTGEAGGLWKSDDAGLTWAQVQRPISVAENSPHRQVPWAARLSKLVVGRGHTLFATTPGGLVRSTNGGATWQLVLAPQQGIGGTSLAAGGDDQMADIELASDGLLYVATATGRVFRSLTPAGTGWTEITPPGTLPYTSIRTELALGGAQTLYAISIAYDENTGGFGARWLRRSADGGRTWAAMTRPVATYYDTDDFTLGLADAYLTFNATTDSTTYLTAYDQLYQTTDGGRTWTPGVPIDPTTALLPLGDGQVAWGGEVALRYAPNLDGVAQTGTTPQQRRTKGFGGLAGVGTAMRDVAGSTYRLVGSSHEPGLLELVGLGSAPTVSLPAYPLRPIIDRDMPAFELAMTIGDGFLWRNTALQPDWQYAATTLTTGNTAYRDMSGYDSRTNRLFYWAGNYVMATFWNPTAPPAFAPISTTLGQPTFMKNDSMPNSLLIGTAEGDVYRLTNADQPNVTHNRLAHNVFPVGSSISGIDTGGNADELVVTLANYGVPSVWYTTNGGATWTNKDAPAHGLPDMPVYGVLTNPTNRRQVMLATELGVWITNNISADNPDWQLSSPTLPLVRVAQLAQRPADGLVVATTNGRGLWETTVWATTIPTSPTLLAGPLAHTALCAGGTLSIPFTLVGGNESVQVRLSDGQGRFADSRVVGGGNSSPLSITLPTDVPYGMGYRLRLDVPSLGLSVVLSETLTVNDLSVKEPRITDRRHALDPRLRDRFFTSGSLCPGDTARLYATLPPRPLNGAGTYRWSRDGAVIAGATSATLPATKAGIYSFTVTEFGCSAVSTNPFRLDTTRALTPAILYPTPDDGPLCPGSAAPLVADYPGGGATYQWAHDGVAVGTSSAVYSATQTGAYTYSLVVGTCTAVAPATYLTFSPAILASPIALLNDDAPTLCGTNTVTLYATEQPENTTYQWLRDGLPLAAQTAPDLTVAQPGTYALRVQRAGCAAISSPISVSNSPRLSVGFEQFGSTTVCTGEAVPLYAKRIDQTMQWLRNGVDIPGATGLMYEATEAGSYALRATSGGCSGTSVAVSLAFSQSLTPALSTYARCTAATLSTQDFPRTGTTRFVWLRNGLPIDTDGRSYRTVTEAGVYSLSVSNGVCGGVSRPVSVSIGQPTPPRIEAAEAGVRCANSAVALRVVQGAVSHWRRNGAPLPNATTDRLVATETGVYTAVYQEGNCLTESNALTVTFAEPTSATLGPARLALLPGQSGTLVVALSGVRPWSVSLSDGRRFTDIAESPLLLPVTPTANTSYSITQVANRCGTGSTNGHTRLIVGMADVSVQTWPGRRVVRVGEALTQTVQVLNSGPQVAEGIVLTNRLPAGVALPGSASGTLGGVSSYTVGTLGVGESVTYSIGLRTDRAGTYLNTVEVSAADTPDPDSQPGTGTADGEDDTAGANWRTPDSTTYTAVSPNPNARLLPAPLTNIPAPAANRADLSLMLWGSQRVVARNVDTIRVMVQVRNEGALDTFGVRVGLTIPNGQFSFDGQNWLRANGPAGLSVGMGTIVAGQAPTRTVYWIPSASGQVRAEVTASSVADPDSAPANQATKPGEDDEGVMEVRVR
jgi:trimeric autotransporter adhesin